MSNYDSTLVNLVGGNRPRPGMPRQVPATTSPAPTAPRLPGAPVPAPVSPKQGGTFAEFLRNNPGQVDTWDYIESYLSDGRMGDLVEWAQNLLVEFGEDLSEPQFLQRIRATDTWKVRFRAIEERRKAGLPLISEAEVIATEKSMETVLRQAGLPASFYDSPDDFADLISKNVSPQEFQARIADGFTAVRNDPRVQSEMNRFYGMGLTESDLVAYYLDPDKALSVLEQQRSIASIAARGNAAGYGQVDQATAERLAGQGITADQAQQGFGNLAAQRVLFNPLASEAGNISEDEGIAATFEGNAASQEKIRRRKAEREASFSGGGSYQANRTGGTGAGTSNR